MGCFSQRRLLEVKEWYGRDIMKGVPYKQEEKCGGVEPVGRIYPPKGQSIV